MGTSPKPSDGMPPENSPRSSPTPSHQHPIGWSLQDQEYESREEHEAEIYSETPHEESESEAESTREDVNEVLNHLQGWLESSYKESLFACGGTVAITSKSSAHKEEASSRLSSSISLSSSSITVPSTTPHPPVTLRWDPRDDKTPASHCKLTMPHDGSTPDNLQRLLNDMSPATFGLGGEHVYDETYRKASKFDPTSFTTNFCPYSVGIIDVITQLLLPNPLSNKQRSIKAELYKLNVYTGPSGHFKSHVDTPRSRTQFGSLVVCLPVTHEGGALQVGHGNQNITFDWAPGTDSDGPQLQWAAFYSDCDHEVLPVQSGQRITLTYNLYVTLGNGQLSTEPSALDISQTPLYEHIKTLIDDCAFLPDGGFLGFYTTHAYPHTSRETCLVDILKGLDMTVWQAFQRLGCGVCLRPVLSSAFSGNYGCSKIGTKFELKNLSYVVETTDDWEDMLKNRWGLETVSFEDVSWLNQPNFQNKKAAFAYTAYGNEPSSNLAYSVCAILIGVPKCSDGERMAVETTFKKSGIAEDDWETCPPYDLRDYE